MFITNKKIMEHAQAYNNTNVWEHEGWVYIDSMKYPRVFVREFDGVCTVEVLHEVTFKDQNDPNYMIAVGEKSTGLVFGGRKTICNVVRVKPSGFPPHHFA